MSDRTRPGKERTEFRFGRGNWEAFHDFGAKLSEIEAAAAQWASQLQGIEKPWLVWNAHPDWCWVQQNLVESVGWTPVIGFDPRIGPPKHRTKNAVVVNFNEKLGLSFLHPVFVLEFVYLFIDKLAFWHSDLLLPTEQLKGYAQRFEALQPGETMATSVWRPKRFWRRPSRAWELLCCTTRDASRHQFETGSGWWGNIYAHINCPSETEAQRRKTAIGWDHGAGILYWKRNYRGRLKTIPVGEIDKGHFSPTSHPHVFRRTGTKDTRHLKSQLDMTIALDDACRYIGIEIDPPKADKA